jgi:hypothetical protein
LSVRIAIKGKLPNENLEKSLQEDCDMKRYTARNPDGFIGVQDDSLQEALNLLASFEDAYEELIKSQELISAELEKMKLSGKVKAVCYKKLLAQRLYNLQIVALFARHGIQG